MVEPLRHRQTKGAETDMPGLPPPRHIPTLPVDAPLQARENFGIAVARGRMLPSVRPPMRQEDSRRPVWEFADRPSALASLPSAALNQKGGGITQREGRDDRHERLLVGLAEYSRAACLRLT